MSAAPFVRGHGFGLRSPHHAEILARGVSAVDFVEVISENFLGRGGRPLALLERVRRDVPVALHGVSLSVGSVDPLNRDYLRMLRALCDRVEPVVVSDHLCFGSVGGHYGHDLWPLPCTEEAVTHVVERVSEVQEILGRRLLLENVSSYVTYQSSDMTEWEMVSEIARRADAGILLDVNNVYVSSRNHGFSAEMYIDQIPSARVGQMHLAGHSDHGSHLLDDHGRAVPPEVWTLYRRAVARFGPVPTIIEWDDNVPSLDRLRDESGTAREIERVELAGRARRERVWENVA